MADKGWLLKHEVTLANIGEATGTGASIGRPPLKAMASWIPAFAGKTEQLDKR